MATRSKTRIRITPRTRKSQNLRDALAATNKQYKGTLTKLAK